MKAIFFIIAIYIFNLNVHGQLYGSLMQIEDSLKIKSMLVELSAPEYYYYKDSCPLQKHKQVVLEQLRNNFTENDIAMLDSNIVISFSVDSLGEIIEVNDFLNYSGKYSSVSSAIGIMKKSTPFNVRYYFDKNNKYLGHSGRVIVKFIFYNGTFIDFGIHFSIYGSNAIDSNPYSAGLLPPSRSGVPPAGASLSK